MEQRRINELKDGGRRERSRREREREGEGGRERERERGGGGERERERKRNLKNGRKLKGIRSRGVNRKRKWNRVAEEMRKLRERKWK